ncbi:anti-sigma factor [Methylobacterium brachythecii]|uniref:Anti-sigma-K factor RskA n=1 Tax=Methylobacterium brachythecii TaxID=1176177 RepID=A0A7W6AT11_9HYPH|nr:anti-sigma factor [Methylobacterium brachythecii]MBB3905447.1 anti-sigma-K factor RskA [Methylobacterium brachythecii]GLS44928.1 anti-sigma K factor RskA [Methylobacterium brachythecii]
MSGGPFHSDSEFRAAEFVLGTLPVDERAAMAAELGRDPVAMARVRDWERRLAPLSLAVPDENPPPRLWSAIQQALPGPSALTHPANDNRIAGLAAQVRRWRTAAAGTGLIAAGLALFLALGPRPSEPDARGRYVAVVTSGGDLPALIVSVDTASGTAQVRPVAAKAPDGRSLELWYIGADKSPKTLGLIGSGATRISLPPGTGAGDGLIAVSVEPQGGSPTGQPTGQVVYTGKLIRD